jgi:hypothetical protein
MRLILCVLFFSISILLQAQETKLNFNQLERAVVVVKIHDNQGRMIGHGSGFFINVKGDFVTNFHVVRGASALKVMLNDGSEYDVREVLKHDEYKDLAVCRLNNPNDDTFRYLKISQTEVVKGDKCWAIGTPADDIQQVNTLSEGIISNMHTNGYFFRKWGVRKWEGTRLIQVTAPYTHGSSGGALINEKGDVIGVTCGGDESTDGNRANINFAVDIKELDALEEKSILISPNAVIDYAMLTIIASTPNSVGCDLFLDNVQLGRVVRYYSNLDQICGVNGSINKPILQGNHVLGIGKWNNGLFQKSYDITYVNFYIEAGGCKIILLDNEISNNGAQDQAGKNKPKSNSEINYSNTIFSGLLVGAFNSKDMTYRGFPFHFSYANNFSPKGWGYDIAYTKTKLFFPDSLVSVDNNLVRSVKGRYRNISTGLHYQLGANSKESVTFKMSLNYVGMQERLFFQDGSEKHLKSNVFYPSFGGYCKFHLFNSPFSALAYCDMGAIQKRAFVNLGFLLGYSW